MHAYSQDLRDRVLRALERGERPTAIARRFEVSRRWVHRVRNRWQKSGLRGSLQMGGYRRSRLAALQPLVRDWIEQAPDLTLAALGVAIGIPASLAAARLIESVLYGLKTTDPATIASAALVMIAVAALAAYLPARRASKVDPMVALRYE